MRSFIKHTLSFGLTSLLAVVLIPLTQADFSTECSTYGFYGLDDIYIVQLQETGTDAPSTKCFADDWDVGGDIQNIGTLDKRTQELRFHRMKGGSINVRAVDANGVMTGDNYLIIAPAEKQQAQPSGGGSTTTPQRKKEVFIKIEKPNYTGIDDRDAGYGNGTIKKAMLFSVNAHNTGTDTFDPTETDPLNPDSDHKKYPYNGVVSCGNALGPVTSQYEGRIEYPLLPGGETGAAEMVLFDGEELSNELLDGYIIPCSTQNLEGLYENIAPSAYGFNEFDLMFNGPKNLFEVVNFRKTGEPRPDNLQKAPSLARDRQENRHVPPAGYEDEVITAFDNFINPFPDTNISQLEGRAAAELYRRAVIGGYPDGEFKGDRSVNRAEAAKFLLLARFQAVDEMSNNGQFFDVLDGQWYTKFVVRAAQLGIINGHPDGSFKPGDGVNTAEFLKMLSLTFDLQLNMEHSFTDVPEGVWFEQYAGIAEKYELFPGRTTALMPTEKLSRTDVAVAIYQFLNNR